MDLSAVVTVWWFAELTRCIAVTTSFVLLTRSVLPPAGETGLASRQRCGYRDGVSTSHCPGAGRQGPPWPRQTQG